MNWLQKVPNSHRAASGLEWKLWRKLPWIAVLGTVLLLLALLVLHTLMDAPQDGSAEARWMQMADYFIYAVLIFHWTMVLTVAIGCIIVMVMKGPSYQADSYPVSHSDQPRTTQETDEEAASRRPHDNQKAA